MANGKRINREPSKQNLTPDQMCGARLTSRDGTCTNMAGGNTPHPGYGYCSKHGGNTEAGLKAGARAAGRDFMKKFKDDPANANRRFGGSRYDPSIVHMSPEQALVEEVRRSAAMVRFLEDRIGQWGLEFTNPLLEVFVAHPDGVRYRDPALRKKVDSFLDNLDNEAATDNDGGTGSLPDLIQVDKNTGIGSFTNAREWLYLYREERAHLARTAKMALDAGVASRLVSLAEDQGRILSAALRAVLVALNLSAEQQALVPQIVPQVLRAVANDQPITAELLAATRTPEAIEA